MVLVSLRGVSDLSSIMSDYSDGVWFREMMQLVLLDDTDSDDGAQDIIIIVYTTMMMLPIQWNVCAQYHCLQYLPR